MNIKLLGTVNNFLKFGRRNSSSEVIEKTVNNCGILTINRPSALNAINQNVINYLKGALVRFREDDNITHVILQGNGSKAFCAGGDIREIMSVGMTDPAMATRFTRNEYYLDYVLANYEKPVVALMDGITMGGGCGIALHGRYAVSTERTMLAMPETAIGFFPDCAAAHFLSRLPGGLGTAMGLTGLRLRGAQVHMAGLSSHHISSSQLTELVTRLGSVRGDSAIEAVLTELQDVSPSSSNVEAVPSLMEPIYGGLSSVEEMIEAFQTAASSDDTDSQSREWCRHQMELLARMCPTSLKVTLRLLRDSVELSINDVLRLDYRLAHSLMANPQASNFYEGVRALIVDKDNQPRWSPDSLDKVTVHDIDHLLEPCDGEDTFFSSH